MDCSKVSAYLPSFGKVRFTTLLLYFTSSLEFNIISVIFIVFYFSVSDGNFMLDTRHLIGSVRNIKHTDILVCHCVTFYWGSRSNSRGILLFQKSMPLIRFDQIQTEDRSSI